MRRSGWAVLGAAAASCLGGIATVDDEGLSAALFSVGWVLLGGWLVMVVVDWWKE